MWATAAPSRPASSAAWAICCGVIGSPGCWSGRVILPVTAQVIMTFFCMTIPLQTKAAAAVDLNGGAGRIFQRGGAGFHRSRHIVGRADPLQRGSGSLFVVPGLVAARHELG